MSMEEEHFIIKLQGEDHYHVFSIRIKDTLFDQLNQTAHRGNISRNKLISLILEHYIDAVEFQ